MTKVSVSIPDEVLKFIDNLGNNRSGTIVTILKEYKEQKELKDLEKAYEEYEELSKDDASWWKDWETSSAKDIGKDL